MRLPSVAISACLLAAAAVSAGGVSRRVGEPRFSCRDHANRTGTCDTIRACPPLLKLVANGRRPGRQEIALLRRSQLQCRAATRRGGKPVLLCCARLPPPPPLSAVGPFTGEPEHHPNRPLLEAGQPCGATLVPRIAGGMEVRHGQRPWVALIGYRHTDTGQVSYRCSGALISQQHVVTAAHCLVNLPAQLRLDSVRLGDHNLSRPTDCVTRHDGRPVCGQPQDFRIAELFIHRDYNKPAARLNDMALLKLDRPVKEDDFAGKICLPFGAARHRDYTGVNMTAAGFGQLGPGEDSPPSQVLMEVVLPGVDQRSCATAIRRLGGVLGSRQLCAGGERGRDVCFGDSGAPLVADSGDLAPTLVGLVAYGAKECDGSVPGVFTRITAYLNWILDRIAD